MQEINLLDETFDKNQSTQYHISLQAGTNELSFCILDTVQKKYVAIRHYNLSGTPDLKSVLESDDLLKLTYKDASLMLSDGKCTLIPVSFFDEAKEALISNFNLGVHANHQVAYNNISEASTVNIFTYQEELVASIRTLIPNLKVYHRSTPFIGYMVRMSNKWVQPKCMVSINKTSVDICLAQGRRLEFYNSFDYHDNADILYYILSSLDHFKLSPKESEVYVSANIENHDKVFELLNAYLTNIKFIHPTQRFTYSYIFDGQLINRFANLFNLALCA
jgi:hypothetical protein